MSYGDGMFSLNPLAPETLCRYVVQNAPEHGKVLDAGCGRGDNIKWLCGNTEMQVFGAEYDEKLYNQSKMSCPEANICKAYIECLPWGNKKFDCILMGCVLSLSENIFNALSEAKRTLVRGGVLVLSDVYARGENGVINSSILRYVRTRNEIEHIIGNAGFRLKHFTDYTDELADMAVRLIMDGSCDCGCFGNAEERHKIKMGYGVWVFAAV